MGQLLEIRPGVMIVGEGNAAPFLRSGRDNALVTTDLHGKYYENASRGNIYAASVGITSTGVTPGTSGLNVTPDLAILNPAGSGKNLALLRASVLWVSGTLPAGCMMYEMGTNPLTAITGAGTTATSPTFGVTGAGRVAVAYGQTAITSAGTPTLVRPAGIPIGNAVPLAISTEEVAGSIVVPQGYWLGFHYFGGSGTSPKWGLWMEWEEVPF